MRHVCAIYDKLSEDLAGTLFVVRHPAAAIRIFGDAANDQQSGLYRHIEDYELIELGVIGDDNPTAITPSYQILITGEQWKAAQVRPENPNQETLGL